MKVSDAKDQITIKDALDHARNLFIYNAGQRLNTIRYFFVAYSIMSVAYIQVYRTCADLGKCNAAIGIDIHLTLFALSFLGAIIALVFFALDIRNSNLVWIEEQAMNEAEQVIAYALGMNSIKITNEWRMKCQGFFKTQVFQYKSIIPFTYSVFFTFSSMLIYYNISGYLKLKPVDVCPLISIPFVFIIFIALFMFVARRNSRGRNCAKTLKIVKKGGTDVIGWE